MKSVEKPAIVKEAENPALGVLASEINKAAKDAEASAAENVKAYRNIGLKLLTAKKKVGHGKWCEWLKKNINYSERHVQRWIRLAKTDIQMSDLESAWKAIYGAYDEDDDPDHLPTALKPAGQEDWCSRCIRIGSQVPDCGACNDLSRAAGKKKPKVKKKPDPLKYDEKTAWRGINHFGRQIDALAHQHNLKDDPAYLAAKKAHDATVNKFKELEKKAGV